MANLLFLFWRKEEKISAGYLLVSKNPTSPPKTIPDQGFEVRGQAVPPAQLLKYPISNPATAPAAKPMICFVPMRPPIRYNYQRVSHDQGVLAQLFLIAVDK
jgi:hypothetical protein